MKPWKGSARASKPRPLRIGIATGPTDAYRQGVRDALSALGRPCAACRRAADFYVNSAVVRFMAARPPSRAKIRRAVLTVARALHELHVARARR